jgi:hypothetical protein
MTSHRPQPTPGPGARGPPTTTSPVARPAPARTSRHSHLRPRCERQRGHADAQCFAVPPWLISPKSRRDVIVSQHFVEHLDLRQSVADFAERQWRQLRKSTWPLSGLCRPHRTGEVRAMKIENSLTWRTRVCWVPGVANAKIRPLAPLLILIPAREPPLRLVNAKPSGSYFLPPTQVLVRIPTCENPVIPTVEVGDVGRSAVIACRT